MVKKENEQQNSDLRWNFQVTDALFIAFVTFMGYLITRTYIASYFAYYHIPSIYIEINTTKILEVLNSFFSFFASYNQYIIPFLLIPMPLLKLRNSLFFNLIMRYILLLAFFALLTLYILSFNKLSIILFITMLILLTFFFFIKPIFYTSGTNYLEKVANHYKKEREDGLLRFSLDYFKTRLGIYCVIIPLILSLFPLAEYLGNKKAQEQTNYLILREPQEMVALDTYKDLIIIAPISIKDKTMEAKFQLIEQKSELKEPIQFESINLGKLTIEVPKSLK